jgi:hypothetical protein
MANFTVIANKVIENSHLTGDINSSLLKIAEDYSLNNHEKQRLVEETNIGLFLDKMQNGSQYEDYTLASPVVIDTSDSYGGTARLQKEASEHSFRVDESMFDLTPHPDLVKTAHVSETSTINIGMMNSTEKWERVQSEAIEARKKELEKQASASKAMLSYDFYDSLAHQFKGSSDLIKTAIVLMSDTNPDFIQELLHQSHLKKEEILKGEITKEAIDAVSSITQETWTTVLSKRAEKAESSFMGTVKDTQKVGKGLAAIAKYPFRNPKTTVGLLGVGYVGHKAIKDNRELEERKKMMEIGEESNHAV